MSPFRLLYTLEAMAKLAELEVNPSLTHEFKAVKKALGFMQANIKHPSLQTHKYQSIKGPKGEEVFEAYAEQKTPGAYRIFWYYGPGRGDITVFSIIPHPD